MVSWIQTKTEQQEPGMSHISRNLLKHVAQILLIIFLSVGTIYLFEAPTPLIIVLAVVFGVNVLINAYKGHKIAAWKTRNEQRPPKGGLVIRPEQLKR